MYKDGQTFCLGLFISLLHKIGSCSTLYFLCCYPGVYSLYSDDRDDRRIF